MKKSRLLLGLVLGFLFAFPALSDPAIAPAAPSALSSVTTADAAPQPNFDALASATTLKHATASASETRMSSADPAGGDADYNGPVMSLIDMQVDMITNFRGLGSDPGDNEGGGIGSDSLATRDPGDDGDGSGTEGSGDGLTG